MNELISIIIPIYNVEKYLHCCINSVIRQTYKNLEIILIDDGSPDNCGKICDEYAKKDNRIKVIHKENGGLSSARNAGLDIAKGEYISFIDSDDYVAENFIEKLYKLCKEKDADIAECDFLKFENEIYKIDVECNIKIFTNYEMQKRLYDPPCYMRGVVVWNKLYKKYLYEDMRFPLGKINEDEFVTYKVLYSCQTSICTTDEQLYYYRTNANSIMGQKFNSKRLDVLDAFEERKEFYKTKEEKELYIATVYKYQEILKKLYILSKRQMKKMFTGFATLENALRKNIKEYLQLTTVPIHKKLKMLFFSLLPNTYFEMMRIKDVLIILKRKIRISTFLFKFTKYQKKCKVRGQKEFIIFNAPEHGNIGDHAIIEAEEKLLKKLNLISFEVSTKDNKLYFDTIKNNISSDAIISITGGGFIGSQWLEEEKLVNKVIDTFKNHKIIIFPQTFYFKDNVEGKNELVESVNVFEKARNIYVFARERKTFDFIKKNYKLKNVFLVPDIVLMNEFKDYKFKRRGILLCFRKDVESILLNENKKLIENILKTYGTNITYTDTVVNTDISKKKRSKVIECKLKEFAHSSLVITDRLHGMIFSAITGTPCIALSNYNQKVKGVYEWIRHLDYIVYEENFENIEKDIKNIFRKKEKYTMKIDYYKSLLNVIKEKIQNER